MGILASYRIVQSKFACLQLLSSEHKLFFHLKLYFFIVLCLLNAIKKVLSLFMKMSEAMFKRLGVKISTKKINVELE